MHAVLRRMRIAQAGIFGCRSAPRRAWTAQAICATETIRPFWKASFQRPPRKTMRARYLPYPLPTLLCLLLFCWASGGCAGRQDADPLSGQGTGADPALQAPAEPLPQTRVTPGQSLHVSVSGGNANLNADLQSMLTAYLQSERGLIPAEEPKQADILVRVRIEDIYPLGSKNEPLSAGKALGGAAAGAMLGLLVGSAVDVNGRSGAGWGAGGGALLGLGMALLDSRGKSKVWGLRAGVGISRDGLEPTDADLRRVTVSAEGADMGREDSLPALEDKLSLEVLNALSP